MIQGVLSPGIGVLVDRIGPRWVILAGALLLSVAYMLASLTAMVAELFPGRRFGAIYGIMNLGNGLGGAIGPWYGGLVHDLTGSYRLAFLTAMGFCGIGATCFWVARPAKTGTRR